MKTELLYIKIHTATNGFVINFDEYGSKSQMAIANDTGAMLASVVQLLRNHFHIPQPMEQPEPANDQQQTP